MQWRRGWTAVAATGVAFLGTGAAVATGVPGDTAATAPSTSAAAPSTVPDHLRLERRVTLRALDPASRLSAKGGDLWEMSKLGSFDVPEAAMRAYKHAAGATDIGHPGCELPWTLLAAIGRVESNHGRFGGSVLGIDGVSRPAIRGVALDGEGPVAAIRDTDAGRWDGDTVWDRAVGPMQFIPSTWAAVGRDGDADGVADPNDLDDAALAAAGYLCPDSGSLLAPGAMAEAVLGYNHSDYYVTLVLSFERGYRTGSFTIPSPPVASEPDRIPAAGGSPRTAARPDGKTPVHSGHSERPGKPARPGRPGKPAPGKPVKPGKPAPPPAPGSGQATPAPTPTPAPTMAPGSGRLVGVLSTDGTVWHVGDVVVDVGESLDGPARANYDGDETIETVREELTGLLGTEVTVELEQGRVVRLADLPY